jgi:hypothetical protein
MPATPNSQTGLIPQYAGSYQIVDVPGFTPTSVAGTTTAVQTVTVNGVKARQAATGSMPEIPADAVIAVIPPSHVANVAAVGAWVSADNTISVIFVNANASGTVPPAGSASAPWRFAIMSQDSPRYAFDG